MTKGGYVYILTNRYNRVYYIGVTSNMPKRIHEHRTGVGSKFARKYNCDKLVLVEEYPTIEEAIEREKAMKAWKRQWKTELIESANPEWHDLADTVLG